MFPVVQQKLPGWCGTARRRVGSQAPCRQPELRFPGPRARLALCQLGAGRSPSCQL